MPEVPLEPHDQKGERLKNEILQIFKLSMMLQERFIKENLDVLEEIIRSIVAALGRGNKIVLFGNGGSAADAQHIAAEFVNRYLIDRPPLPAIALTTDTSVLTSIANDFTFDQIFEKQIKAIGSKGDAAVGLSTSGTSRNVVRGLHAARDLGMITIGIGGPEDCPMKKECRYYLGVQGGSTPRIQEVHLLIGHTMVEIADRILFGTVEET
ncbi:MAG: D-sedoheptulose 7-phosphate isomerase [Pseudomonadota bacterium]